jgi:hypothetical protein
MRNGGVGSFVVAPTLADNGVITKKYLRDLEAAVRQRTPVAGANIDIKVTDGSYVISSTPGINIAGGVPEGFTAVTLTVCSNGTPDEILVLGKID